MSICAFANFASAVKAEGLGFKPVSGDVKTFMANLMNGANGVAFLKQVRDTLREFIEPFLADLEAATEDAQAIVGTYFGQVFQSLAEMRHVPYVQTQYFPIDPNPQAPIASAPGQRVGKAWNLATYQLGHLLISTLEKYYLSDWRQSRGMSPRKLEAAPCYELCRAPDSGALCHQPADYAPARALGGEHPHDGLLAGPAREHLPAGPGARGFSRRG